LSNDGPISRFLFLVICKEESRTVRPVNTENDMDRAFPTHLILELSDFTVPIQQRLEAPFLDNFLLADYTLTTEFLRSYWILRFKPATARSGRLH